MAVAEHDEVTLGEPAAQPRLAAAAGPAVVDHRHHPHGVQLDFACLREIDQVDVVVAAYGVDGCEGAQRVEELRADDVIRVRITSALRNSDQARSGRRGAP